MVSTARPVDLGGLLAIAVRSEPRLTRARIDVLAADAAVLSAAGIDDWLLAATGAWWSRRIEGINIVQEGVGLDVNLGRALPTGGALSLRAQTRRTSATNTNYINSVEATFVQPLWQGRGRAVARAEQARTRAERDVATLLRESTASEVVEEIVTAYWSLAQAWLELDIRRGDLALAEEQLRNTQKNIAAGAVSAAESLSVRHHLVDTRNAIVRAQLVIVERSLELRRLVGLDVQPDDVTLRVSVPATIARRQFDLAAMLTRALERNPRLAALRAGARGVELAMGVAEDALEPSLDLELGFGPLGLADEPGASLNNMVSLDDVVFRVGLTFRQALGQRAAHGRLAEVRATRSGYQVELAEMRAQLGRAVVLELARLQSAQEQMDLAQESIALSEESVSAVTLRYQNGSATNFEVLERIDDLEQARLDRAGALIGYLKSTTALQAITGDLLGRYGITLESGSGD